MLFTCAGWPVRLCDPIWQLTLIISEMEYDEELYHLTLILYFYFILFNINRC